MSESTTTRTPLADVDTSRYTGTLSIKKVFERVDRLECDRVVLLDALRDAIDTIRVWHSTHDPDAASWDIYREHAPEMKRLTAAVAKAERA